MNQVRERVASPMKQTIGNIFETVGKYLTFLMVKQLLAVPIKDVVQIVRIREFAAIPKFDS